jgi:hypothetical protein
MGEDVATTASDDIAELEALESEIERETAALAELQERTREVNEELARWKSRWRPPTSSSPVTYGIGGFILGWAASFVLGRLLLAVLG